MRCALHLPAPALAAGTWTATCGARPVPFGRYVDLPPAAPVAVRGAGAAGGVAWSLTLTVVLPGPEVRRADVYLPPWPYPG